MIHDPRSIWQTESPETDLSQARHVLCGHPKGPRHTKNSTRSEFTICSEFREWPRYCRKVCWTKTVQNGPNDQFGQKALIPNWILAFLRPFNGPKWSILVHFGPFRSANRTLPIPENLVHAVIHY